MSIFGKILPDLEQKEVDEAFPLDGVREAMSWLRDKYAIEVSASGTILKEKSRNGTRQTLSPL